MSEVGNNEQCGDVKSAPVINATKAVASAEVEELVTIDAAAAGDAANAIDASKPTEFAASPKADSNKKTPAKRTPSKRMSFIERAQKESEELVKNMGGSLELEGGRRTRSSARGTPTRTPAAATPPPIKKARTSPANATSTTPSRARGRGRKIDTSTEPVEQEEKKAQVVEEAQKSPAESTEAQETSTESRDKLEEDTTDTKDNSEITNVDVTKSTSNKEAQANSVAEEKNVENDGVESDALKSVADVEENNVDHATEEEQSQKEDEPNDEVEAMEICEELESEQKNTTTEPENSLTGIEKPNKTADAPGIKATETTIPAAEAEAAVAADDKEPTPEPMEVYGAMKSNEDVDENKVVEKSKIADSEVSSSVEPAIAATQVETAANDEPTVPVEKVVEHVADVKSNDVQLITDKTNAVETKSSKVEVEPETIPTETATDIVASKELTPASETKPGNDLCEPKIASPPMNAASDATATTPQFCN